MTDSPINNTVSIAGITTREDLALHFLSNKMEATAAMVGWEFYQGCGAQRAGASVLGKLLKKGMVMRLPELNAWRLTKEGRAYVKRTTR